MKSEPTFFDQERAQNYDKGIRQHIPGYEVMHAMSETILAAELPENASVLVAGIGTAMEVEAWSPKHPGWRFAGVDTSPAMMGLANQKLNANGLADRVKLTLGQVEALPADITFDAATLLLVLHFIPDNGEKEALMSAIADRLKPGAPFIMATAFGDPETTRYKRMISHTKAWALGLGADAQKVEEIYSPTRKDLHVVPENRIKDLFRYAGFIDVQRIYQAFAIGVWFARTPRGPIGAGALPQPQ